MRLDLFLPALVAIAVLLLTTYFQNRAWKRTAIEEIRKRETDAAISALHAIVNAVDRRIAKQRTFMGHLLRGEVGDNVIEAYRSTIEEWNSSINQIRSQLSFYFWYRTVLEFEKIISSRLAEVGANSELVYKRVKSEQHIGTNEQSLLRKDLQFLNVLSAKTYRFTAYLQQRVAKEDFGTLKSVHDVYDPKNRFVGKTELISQILNLK